MSATESPVSSTSTEAEAKDRAASVVLAWREIDWDAVERGDRDAVQSLLNVSENHEETRHFLREQAGGLGTKLDEGLERFWAGEIGPRMRNPGVLRALGTASAWDETPQAPEPDGMEPRARPQVTVGHTVKMNTGCGHLYVTINESEDGEPFELFNHMGKAGGCAASQNEAIGRLISYALRCGASIDPLLKQLKGISCHRPAWGEDGKISSCSDAIGKAIEKYSTARQERRAQWAAAEAAGNGNGNGHTVAEGSDARFVADESAGVSDDVWSDRAPAVSRSAEASKVQGACVDCGGQLSYEEGCVKCHSCGFTECG